MKRNSRDYPEFYNWLIQPFIKKPHRIQLLRRLNRLLTFVMPGVYGLVFCWLFAKQVSLEKMWPYFHVPLSIIFVFRPLFPVFVSYVSLCSSPWRCSLSQGCSGGVGTWYPMGRTLFSGLNEQNGSNCPLNKGASSCILNE